MTTTRRRSSVGSAAAAPDPPAASTPSSARSSRRRTSAVRTRDSDALDLGLLGRSSPRLGGGGGDSTPSSISGRRRAFRFFEDDDEEEGGALTIGGWRVRPMHVLGSLFLLGLFSILTLLTLYPGVSDGLSNDLSFTGPKRVSGSGRASNASMDELAALVASPAVLEMLEVTIEQRLLEFEAEKDELRQDMDGVMSLLAEIRAKAAEGVGAGEHVDLGAHVGELGVVKAQMEALQARVDQYMAPSPEERHLGPEQLAALKAVDVKGMVADVAALQARFEALEAQQAEAAEATQAGGGVEGVKAAFQKRLGELSAQVQGLVARVEGKDAEVLAAAAEMKELLAQAQASVLVEEARSIRAAVEGEVGALKEQMLALASATPAGTNVGADVDLGVLRAAVAEAAAQAQAQLAVKVGMEEQLAEARGVIARLQEASAEAAAIVGAAGEGAGGEKLGELEAELVRVKEVEAALAGQVQEQEARVAAAVAEMKKTALEAHQAQAEAAAAASQQGPRLDEGAIKALVEAQVAKLIEELAPANESAAAEPPALDAAAVQALVEEEVGRRQLTLAEQEAGFTGHDYAAAALGGRVVRGLCSATYTPRNQRLPSDLYEFFGYRGQVHPRAVVISDGVLTQKRAGQCWAFAGASGRFTVELPQAVVPTSVVLEHIAKALSRNPGTAPRRFAVFGRQSVKDKDPVKLHSAEYLTYDIHRGETPAGAAQRFALDYRGPPVRVVTLEVVDNWGHSEYTCLYRFRVLAEPDA